MMGLNLPKDDDLHLGGGTTIIVRDVTTKNESAPVSEPTKDLEAGTGIEIAENIDNETDVIGLLNKTSFVAIDPHSFKASSPETAVIDYSPWGKIVNGSGGNQQMWQDVQLPQGAVITAAVVYGTVTAGDSWTLFRISIDGESVSSMASGALGTEDTSIAGGAIDNENYKYMMSVQAWANTKELFGTRITFTTYYI